MHHLVRPVLGGTYKERPPKPSRPRQRPSPSSSPYSELPAPAFGNASQCAPVHGASDSPAHRCLPFLPVLCCYTLSSGPRGHSGLRFLPGPLHTLRPPPVLLACGGPISSLLRQAQLASPAWEAAWAPVRVPCACLQCVCKQEKKKRSSYVFFVPFTNV